MSGIELVAWDFDGVLNRNIRDGRFIWADRFEADLGLPLDDFRGYLFGSGRFQDVLVGRQDLRDVLDDWLRRQDSSMTPEAFMSYWFHQDAHPDPDILALTDRLAARSVIATNNEQHRAAFIWEEMGLSTQFERIFAAGPMGVKKPDPAFFAQIEAWSGLPGKASLLVDDHAPNVEAAQACGWHAFHLTDASRPGLEAALVGMGLLAPEPSTQ